MKNQLKKLAGVTSANVNLATESLQIDFDETKTSLDSIYKTIDKIGYKAVENKKTESFDVSGMTCAACSRAVERLSRKQKGVIDVSVNLAQETMTLTYNDELNINELFKKILISGYKVTRPKGYEANQLEKNKSLFIMKVKLGTAIIFYDTLTLYSNGTHGWFIRP